MRFDLSGVFIPGEPKPLDKFFTNLYPIGLRISEGEGIVVSDRTIKFTKIFDFFHGIELSAQPSYVVCKLFSHGRW